MGARRGRGGAVAWTERSTTAQQTSAARTARGGRGQRRELQNNRGKGEDDGQGGCSRRGRMM